MDGPEHRTVIWAAGVAAAALVGILVFAVVRMSASTDSVRPPGTVAPATSVAGSSATTRKTAGSTSYAVPSVQTSQAGAPVVSGPPPASTDEGPATDDSSSSSAPTTSNPYNTTTPTNAGHV